MSAPSFQTFHKIYVFKSKLCHISGCMNSLHKSSWRSYHIPTYEEEDPVYRKLRQTVARWQIHPHEIQLEKLQYRAAYALKKFKNIATIFPKDQITYFLEHCDQFDGQPCELVTVRPSPVLDSYRNKDSLVIGLDMNGALDIGFYKPPGKFPDMPVCGRPLKLQKTKHLDIFQAFKQFVSSSDFPPIGHKYHPEGGWKEVMVRSNQNGEIMVATTVSPFDASRDRLDRIRDSVQEFFLTREGRHLGIHSLYHRELNGYASAEFGDMFKHIHGKVHLTETLLGKQFQIHPNSFFQINTQAAEVLYRTIEELCQLKENTVLLDICCGTGTIGILLSDKVRKVYGIEYIEAAVEDAKVNCNNNGVSNIEYFCGRAEKLIRTVLEEHLQAGDEVVAVVNPGRGGMGKKVTRALRRHENINRVVFASCNAIGRMKYNFSELCRPEDTRVYRGAPFLPIKAVPVDMFPHTGHYELVLLFER